MSDEPLQTNAADVDQVARATRSRKDEARAVLEDTREVLSTYRGRRFLDRLLGICLLDDPIRGTSDEVFRQLGRRDVGLAIEELLRRHPDLQQQLRTEAEKRRADIRAERRAATTT